MHFGVRLGFVMHMLTFHNTFDSSVQSLCTCMRIIFVVIIYLENEKRRVKFQALQLLKKEVRAYV